MVIDTCHYVDILHWEEYVSPVSIDELKQDAVKVKGQYTTQSSYTNTAYFILSFTWQLLENKCFSDALETTKGPITWSWQALKRSLILSPDI